MKMLGHDEFIIHQRRAKFASDRRDFHRLPVEGSAAFEGRTGPRNPLADLVGQLALFVAFATLTYMLGRIAYGAIFGG
jgi:hypothetical protein